MSLCAKVEVVVRTLKIDQEHKATRSWDDDKSTLA